MSRPRLSTRAFTYYYVIACIVAVIFNMTVQPEVRNSLTTPEYRTYAEQAAEYPHPSVIVELQKQRAFEEAVAGRAEPETLGDPNLREIAVELRYVGQQAAGKNLPLWAVAVETAETYMANRYRPDWHEVHRWVKCVGPEKQNCLFTGELKILNDPARLSKVWVVAGPKLNDALTTVPAKPQLPHGVARYIIGTTAMLLLHWLLASLAFAGAYFGFGMAMNRIDARRDDMINDWGNPLTSTLPSWFSCMLIALHLPGFLLIKIAYRTGVAANDLFTRVHSRFTMPKDCIAKLQLKLESALEHEAVKRQPELQERLRAAIDDLRSERQKPSAKAVRILIEEAEMQTAALREAEDQLADFDASLEKASRKS